MRNFNRTHIRKPVKARRGPKVEAELLATPGDGTVAYRVRYREGSRTIQRITTASEGHFMETFEVAA